MTLEELGRALQRHAIRTGSGPLRPVWAATHRCVIWAVAKWVSADLRDSRTYLKGGFGFGEPVYGLSDVDMIIVIDGDPRSPGKTRGRLLERWRRLTVRFPTLTDLFQLWVYEEADLRRLDGATYLSFERSGLDDERPSAPAFLGRRAPSDPMALLDRPGLYGPRRDWRRLGSPRRPPAPISDLSAQTMFAWLELRFLWTHAFLTVVDPTRDSAAYTCQKLVADSARILLWLRFGERIFDREETLRRALQRMPEEARALRQAIDLGRRLPHHPSPPIEDALPFLVRTSSTIAEHLASTADRTSATKVRLAWDKPHRLLLSDEAITRASTLVTGGHRPALVPLADWRARAVPQMLDPALAVVPGDPGDPQRLRELAQANHIGLFPALRTNGILVLPTSDVWDHGRLRGIEWAGSDPVSMALINGSATASFPDLSGWSARDCARRALDEHRGWLELGTGAGGRLPYWIKGDTWPEVIELAGLFTAARAAMFADSLEAGDPELQLTAATIAGRLAEYGTTAGAAAGAAYEELSECTRHERAPDARVVGGLRAVVQALPGYTSPTSGSARHIG
jgi:hypothetical protein